MANLKALQANVWLQPRGCGEELYKLECAWPNGDVTYGDSAKEIGYCFRNGKWEQRGALETIPETVEFSIIADVETQSNIMDAILSEKICSFPMFVVIKCLRPGFFEGWDVVLRIENAIPSPSAFSGFTDGQSDGFLTNTYNFSVAQTDIKPLWRLNNYPIANSIYAFDLNAVGFCEPDVVCTTDCDDVVVSGCESAAIAGANDGVTGAFGLTLNSTCSTLEFRDAVVPVVAGIVSSVGAVLCIPGTDTQIYAVSLVTPGALNVSVVEDEGTPVTVIVDGAGGNPTGPNIITADLIGGVHIVTSTGYVYRSLDSGLIWEATDAGVASGGAALNAITFRNERFGLAGGAGGVIIATINSGESWYGVTQTDITTDIVSIEYADDSWIFFTTDGKMYRSAFNKGLTEFAETTIPGTTGNTLVDAVVDGCTIVVVYNKAAGTNPGSIIESVNGGTTWEPVVTTTNTGYNAIARQGNNYVVVGDGGTAQKMSRVLPL